VLAGSALFLVGAIVVTKAANVPLNDADDVDPEWPGCGRALGSYLPTGPRGTTPVPSRRSPRRGC
jgi:uncharacterized membrane protein